MTTKKPPLKRMFSKVPDRYDLVNRVITVGLDRKWRRLAVAKCLEHGPRSILDLCTGTGDLAADLARQADDGSKILAVDFNRSMLEVAELKTREAGVEDRVSFELADVAHLPFEDASFDTVGIAFGFRNLTFNNAHRDKHLREISRIIKPSGRFVIVESSQPRSKLVGLGFHSYLKNFVAPIGGIISKERGPYRYLAHSAANFYNDKEVADLLLGVSFSSVKTVPLLFGAVAIHIATK
ncbi:MAG: ubiquinone/menaquinone biosynthesis methyltransferase [Proteobacteria bacterium]|nr:ubiquinone/menaquinone biosynthesis methyltransferase [Pseudomonadota bacterium]